MKALYGLLAAALLLVLAVPAGLDSCAIAPPGPVFTATRGPADLKVFLTGRVGVVQAAMRRTYLIGAYRMLSGVPLSDREAAALYPPKRPATAEPADEPPLQAWLEARRQIPGATRIDYLQTDRSRTSPDSFAFFTNCLDDAFASAKRTLEARAKRWGGDSAGLKEWLAAQDLVFGNCAGEQPSIPAAPLPAMDALAAADRRYQIAAAYFYAGNWEQAAQDFDAIAADAGSPWSGIAPYLTGRTFLREALVDNRQAAFDEAERRFNAILQDEARMPWHEASRKMLDLIRTRRDPGARLRQLGEALMHRDGAGDAGDAAAEFVYLYGRRGGGKPAPDAGELAEWIEVIESPSVQTLGASVSHWRETGNPAWLIAALAVPEKQYNEELVRAARLVPPGSPAYESAVYYGIARETAGGRRDEARAWADEVLRRDLPLSSRNLILGERLQLARDWAGFLRFAPRRPEPHLESFDDGEEETNSPPAGTAPIFDTDAIAVLNGEAPLSLWVDAVGNRLLPAPLQLQLAEAGWIRAVLLDRHQEARALVERIVQLRPAYAAAARPFLTAANPDEARFAAVLLLLRTPELVPDLQGGDAAPDLSKVSGLGGGRWCFPGNAQDGARNAPEFLTAGQKSEAEAERIALRNASESGANYLAAQAIAWAQNHAEDPRVPEALHLVVLATRRGCTNTATGRYSRQAFDLLHQRFPKSPWTARTPYWYR